MGAEAKEVLAKIKSLLKERTEVLNELEDEREEHLQTLEELLTLSEGTFNSWKSYLVSVGEVPGYTLSEKSKELIKNPEEEEKVCFFSDAPAEEGDQSNEKTSQNQKKKTKKPN